MYEVNLSENQTKVG